MWSDHAANIHVIDVPSLHAHLTGVGATLVVAPVLARALAECEGRKEGKAACATAV